MRTRAGKFLFWSFLLLYAVALTWPGMLPFDRIHPLILGLPFVVAWVAAWVAAGAVVLWWVDRIEARARAEARQRERG